MRLKIIIVLFVLAGLGLAAALFLRPHPAAPPTGPESVTSAPPEVTNVEASVVSAPAPAAAAPTNTLTPEQQQAAINTEVDRLQQWSMKDDPASLASILADLANPEKDIRDAAIEAAKQFGSTNAIPALKAAANATEDTQEKIALLQAADFLALPSANFGGSATDAPRTPEQIQADEQKVAEAEAHRQPRVHKSVGSQNSQPPPDQSAAPATGN